MPNEPKADWEKEAQAVLASLRWYGPAPGAENDARHTALARDRAKIAAAIREAHASGTREAEEKRHPGSEPPKPNHDVLGYYRAPESFAIVWWDPDHAKWRDSRGSLIRAPDFWLELPDASRAGGKETK
jgi:hypothetical protein